MKQFFSVFLVLAMLNLSFANFSFGGEVEKKPLQLEEMIELAKEQANDYQETRETDAGLKDGYGVLALAMAAAIGYFVYDQIQDDD